MRQIIFWGVLGTTLTCNATGVWTKPGTSSVMRQWPTEFMKSGAFAIHGHFKSSHIPLRSRKPVVCNESVERFAWVTRKISPGEILTPEAGKTLGENLSNAFGIGCWNGVQLDVEPLRQPPAEWVPFLSAVRAALIPKLKLHAAIPAVTVRQIPGLHWNRAQANESLGAIDGIALMLYDTGEQTQAEYSAIIKESAVYARSAASQFPEKRITLGLPAYEDRTALHKKGVETLTVALDALMEVPPCEKNLRLALYAEWTLDKKEVTAAETFENWLRENCEGASK